MIDRPCLRALVPGGLLVALLLVAPVAGAAPPSDDDGTSQQIAALYKRANALYIQKSYAEAEALYLEAWRLKKTYDVACNLGAVEIDLGKPREAAEYLAFALRDFPAGEKAAAREQIKARMTLVRAEVGALHVRVNVAGAEVSVGGRVVGYAPVDDEVFVSQGTVTVSASAPGYEQALKSVQVAKGGAADVVLTLKEPRRSVVPGAVMGGLAGVPLVIGVVLEAVAASKRSSVQTTSASIVSEHHSCIPNAGNYDPRCPGITDTAHSSDTLHDAGIGVLVGAGALAVGSVAYFLWPASKPGRASGLLAAPMVSTTGAGLSFSGSF